MSDFNSIELATSVDLTYNVNSEKTPVYHLVYASQLYGTVFAIYGRFEGTETTVGGKKAFAVEKISLALLNYKGIINIGFSNDVPTWSSNDKMLSFSVQGTSTVVDQVVPISGSLVVEKGTPSQVTFNRLLLPLPGFQSFLGSRSASSPNPGHQIKSVPPVSALFDSEFNDRDGIDFYNRDLKPGMDGYRHTGSFLVAQPRCVQSNLRLIYY